MNDDLTVFSAARRAENLKFGYARGSDLKIGDVIETWGGIKRKTIIRFREAHPDTIALLGPGTRIAEFAESTLGMTIEPRDRWEIVHAATT